MGSTVAKDVRSRSHSPSWRSLLEEPSEIARHTLGLIAALVSIWLVHIVLKYLLGEDAKLYNFVPIRYIIETGDLAVLVRFIWKVVRQIWREE
jgi:hypothetical protein